MRIKIDRLEEALNGRFDRHHAFLLTRMLGRIDTLDADITLGLGGHPPQLPGRNHPRMSQLSLIFRTLGVSSSLRGGAEFVWTIR